MRYKLMVKSAPGAAASSVAPPPNPAMQRRSTVPMDEGRQWAGEPYDEGEVSDPTQAFARFTEPDNPDVEAWLDRNPDGTLIGWVRDGADIYRYSDPEAWALDVDGNQMQRADGGAPADGNAPADGSAPADGQAAADPNAAPPDPAAAPQAQSQAAGRSTAQAQGDQNPPNPDGFRNEPDPAGDVYPDARTADQPLDPAKHAEREQVVTGKGEEEWDNPFADLTDEEDNTDDGDGQDAESPAEDATDEPPPAQGNGKMKPPPTKRKKKRKVPPPMQKKTLLGGRVQVKHLPGQHDQEDHGNWADDGIKSAAESALHAAEKVGKEVIDAAAKGRAVHPKASKPAKASLSAKTIKNLSDEDLEAITESGELYDMDTMLNAAAEMDSRHDIDAMTRGFAKHTEPGSPERQALFDSVIPEHWATWAAMGAKGRKPRKRSKRDEIREHYNEYVESQMARAGEYLRGGSAMNKQGKAAGFKEQDFFNGGVSSTQFRKYASEELARFFAMPGERRMTFSDFAAEFYPSYAKAKAKVGSRYISEFG